MKIRELNNFSKELKKEFCDYLKQYFKESRKVRWTYNDRIVVEIDFKNAGKKRFCVVITDRKTFRIHLNELESDINTLEFKKYVEKFLNKKYVVKTIYTKRTEENIMQRYALSEIVGGYLMLIHLKQFLKPMVDLNAIGIMKGRKPQKYYTLDEIRFIRNAYIKRKKTMKRPYYSTCEREVAFERLQDFLTCVDNGIPINKSIKVIKI